MISVVLATYNSIRYIKKQLDSIVKQTVPVNEVIIVDDYSTDDTVAFIRNYILENNLDNWKVYRHEKNQGYIETFRDALGDAKGDIIITCDHDDVWLENKVEVIKKEFVNNPSILYLATSFVQIDENDNEVVIKQKKNRGNNNLIRRRVHKGKLTKMYVKDVAIYNIAPGCTCAMNKKLRDIYIPADEHILPHDWTLAIMAACKSGLYYLDVPTTKYRIHSDNAIGLGHEGKYSKRLKVVKKNVLEKERISEIIEQFEIDAKTMNYMKSVNKIFCERYKYLKEKNIIKLLILSVVSLRFGTVYESIIYDCISILNGE